MFKFLSAGLASLLLLLPHVAGAADLKVEARADYLIDATVNGQPVRLRVDPGAPGYLILNPATATRLGLTPSLMRARTRIGPVRLTGSSREADVAIGGAAGRRRLLWFDRPVIAGADGLIGPADLPYDRVTFELAAPRDGEAQFEMPLEYTRGTGLYLPLRVGEHDFRFLFSLAKPFGLATAGAGAILAASYGGSWTGAAIDQPIDFEVVRPARPMGFAQPISLHGLELRAVHVRTGDNRGNLSLPPEPDADPDEVVVTAASGQRAAFVVVVGRDLLSRCSSLVWDNHIRRLSLRCLVPDSVARVPATGRRG